MKKKIAALILAVVVVAGGIGGIVWKNHGSVSGSDNVVYVGSVAQVGNPGSGFSLGNRFAGVVESENVWKLKKSPERTVGEIVVETGQEVKKGDLLFSYDIEEELGKIEQGKLDLERIENEKNGMAANIAELEKERQNAKGDQKTTLTLEIQQEQLNLKRKDYEIKEKQNEIDKLEKAVQNASVFSEIDGVIKSIASENQDFSYYEGQDDSFITVISTGAFQIKGSINEQNLGMGELMEGTPVLVHSRVDESITWRGVVDRIDMENATSNNNNFYYSGSDSMNMTSSYPFYVKLESSENLMLGQHVYVEVDTGDQTEKEGLWISFWYVNDLNSKPFVWADNGKGKLEKRTVEVGEIDEFSGLVQILGGLTGEDHITWPEEGLEEGMPTVVTTDGTMGQSNPAYDEMENWEEESEFMGESGAWLEEEGDGALMQETEGIEMSESGVE